MSKLKTEFANPHEAGYDAGKYGANTFNSNFSLFNTKERMQEWQRGNNAGLKKREVENNNKKLQP